MYQKKTNPEMKAETTEAGWSGLYKAAGVGALLTVGSVLLDMAVSFAGGDAGVGRLNAAGWFALFQRDGFAGLRNLGLLNVINALLAIPLYLALYRLHRRSSPTGAALALILCLLGAAVYTANNRALTMLALSQQYTAAATEAHRALLESAGTAILAQAEDFTPGAFPGFLLSSLSSLLMMAVMLRGRVFSRPVGLTGLFGAASMLVFTISVTFAPATFERMMLLAMTGGLLMLAWQVRMVIAMFRLGRAASTRAASASLPAGIPLPGRGR